MTCTINQHFKDSHLPVHDLSSVVLHLNLRSGSSLVIRGAEQLPVKEQYCSWTHHVRGMSVYCQDRKYDMIM